MEKVRSCQHELYEFAFADPDEYKFECILCGKKFKEATQSLADFRAMKDSLGAK